MALIDLDFCETASLNVLWSFDAQGRLVGGIYEKIVITLRALAA